MFSIANIASVLALAAIAKAHFVLQIPTSLGFDDATEATGPCDGFDPASRGTGVTDWPVNGASIGVLTTHTHVTWHINYALLSDTSKWSPLSADIDQIGVGSYCIDHTPGVSSLVGQDAVLQVVQVGVDGTLYQCAAIKFVAGGPAAIPGACTNSTGVTASYIPGTGPVSVTPSSSTPAPTSSTASSSPSSSSEVDSTTGSTSTGGSTAGSTTVSLTSTKSQTSSTSATGSGSAVSSSIKTTSTTNSTKSTSTSTSSIVQVTGGSNVLHAGGVVAVIGGGIIAMMGLSI